MIKAIIQLRLSLLSVLPSILKVSTAKKFSLWLKGSRYSKVALEPFSKIASTSLVALGTLL
ncbi:hypothetical protein HP9810_886g1 [Helicobacter pylori 98-10]|nr:hypothetical protein HP9810_886g1 [Helicobacter pylori 98-10]